MRRLVIFPLLALLLILAGCNSGISSDAAAKAFINALFNGNAQAARDVMCASAQPSLTDEAVAAFGAMQVDTSALSYSVRNPTDTTANVVVSGNVQVGPSGAQQQMDFATIGGVLTTLPAVVENSAWKICPTTLTPQP